MLPRCRAAKAPLTSRVMPPQDGERPRDNPCKRYARAEAPNGISNSPHFKISDSGPRAEYLCCTPRSSGVFQLHAQGRSSQVQSIGPRLFCFWASVDHLRPPYMQSIASFTDSRPRRDSIGAKQQGFALAFRNGSLRGRSILQTVYLLEPSVRLEGFPKHFRIPTQHLPTYKGNLVIMTLSNSGPYFVDCNGPRLAADRQAAACISLPMHGRDNANRLSASSRVKQSPCCMRNRDLQQKAIHQPKQKQRHGARWRSDQKLL